MKKLNNLPVNVKNALFELKKKLQEKFGEKAKVYLFGSYARRENTEYSDIDVLVLLDDKVNTSKEVEIFDIAYKIELEYDVVFGIIVYSKFHWESIKHLQSPLYTNIKKEGIPL